MELYNAPIALPLIEIKARACQTASLTVQSPLVWSATADWKLDYQNPARLSAQEIAQRRADFDRQKAVAKALREDLDVDKVV